MAAQQTHKSALYIVFDDNCFGVNGIAYLRGIKYYIKGQNKDFFNLGSDIVSLLEAQRVGFDTHKIPELSGEYSGK